MIKFDELRKLSELQMKIGNLQYSVLEKEEQLLKEKCGTLNDIYYVTRDIDYLKDEIKVVTNIRDVNGKIKDTINIEINIKIN